MKILGKEGKLIEPPNIFDPVEMPGDVVAKFVPTENNGKVQALSTQQMYDMELNTDDVHEMIKELHAMAKGKEWRLEVAEMPDGMRELRGIVEDDDDQQKPTEALKEQNDLGRDRGSDQGTDRSKNPGKARPKEPQAAQGEAEGGNDPWTAADDDGEGSEETYKDEL